MCLVGGEAADVVPLIASLVGEQLQHEPDQRRPPHLRRRDPAARRGAEREGDGDDDRLDQILRPRDDEIAQQLSIRSPLPPRRLHTRLQRPASLESGHLVGITLRLAKKRVSAPDVPGGVA
jgi:hypothetical protein